jgi:hypothetical protein
MVGEIAPTTVRAGACGWATEISASLEQSAAAGRAGGIDREPG